MLSANEVSSMKLFRKWPAPPMMSETQYLRYRLRLLALILVWAACLALLIFCWGAVPFVLKAVIVIGLFFVAPDIDAVEQLLTPYAKYTKSGLG